MNVRSIRKDFPILAREVHGKALVYLDNAATTQKPKQVIEALVDYYENHNANVHRGIHTLGDESTKLYQVARQDVAAFLGAKPKELIFVRNTTEAINLVAYAWAREQLNEGEIIVTSELEHHSNLVTWQEAAKATGAGIAYLRVDEEGKVDIEDLKQFLDEAGRQVRLVALSAVSNATGAELPVTQVTSLVREKAKGARILIDGAQNVAHKKTDFAGWDIDFLAFSGHKMYGPMGVGGLVVREKVYQEMGPFLVGGGMIAEVELMGTKFAEVPDRYDAGTPNVAGAVGLAAACRYLQDVGMDEVEEHGRELVGYALEKLGKAPRIEVIGPLEAKQRLGSVAFRYDGVHAHDVAQVLDSVGIAVRSGHHCTMPLHSKFEWIATTRASFGIYNTREEIDALTEGLKQVKKIFR